jgi:F-type H+-transporting ATPase subunit b
MLTPFPAACELKNKVRTALFAIALIAFAPSVFVGTSAFAAAQEHAAATAGQAQPEHPAEPEHAEEHGLGDMILGLGWPIANFIIFLGVIYYFGNKPFKEYLANRHSTIRKDLDEARSMNAAAAAQLLTVDERLKSLPGEIDALRKRGTEEIQAEEQRIAAAAAADRDRLLEQTRREIDLQVRLAKKEILEHAADLSVQLATDRIKKEVTPADQDRLVDRYLQQVKEN